MKVAGIDPGKSGGFSVWDADDAQLLHAGPLVFDDPKLLKDWLWDVDEILIERAQSAPGQGNGFEYGRSFGRTEAVCMITDATIYYCAPVWWKRRMKMPTDKEAGRQFALKTIPGLDKFVTLKGHDGIAEAAMIGKLMTSQKLVEELVKNNEVRKAPKKKRASYRL